MKVTVHYRDGEQLKGDSEAAALTKMGFPMTPEASNTERVWVSLAGIKYIVLHGGPRETTETDPREGVNDIAKVVIRFLDGETIRTYQDDNFAAEGEGITVRVWDSETKTLERVLVSYHTLKGIYTVKEWDSRHPDEKLLYAASVTKNPKKEFNARANKVSPKHLVAQVQARLTEVSDPHLSSRDPKVYLEALERHLDRLLKNDGVTLTPVELDTLAATFMRMAFGYGPLDALLRDPSVTEIMVNGPEHIYVEREGQIQATNLTFESVGEVLNVIQKMVTSLGRRIDESSPMVDGRLPDGSRVNAAIAPAAIGGPFLTIRKFKSVLHDLDQLVKQETLSPDMGLFLRAAVAGRLNILISGGTGSGKTTTLNVCSSLIPPDNRIVTVEDSAELQINHPHVLSMEARPANIEGRGALSIRDLVKNTLRMRPDRIIIGEVRGNEAIDMVQAMNTGHDGSMSTIHANSPRDALFRLETLVSMSDMDISSRAVRSQIGSGLDLIIHQHRLPDGTRRITQIAEVLPDEVDGFKTYDIFVWEPDSGFVATGYKPQSLKKMRLYGVEAPAKLFKAPSPEEASA